MEFKAIDKECEEVLKEVVRQTEEAKDEGSNTVPELSFLKYGSIIDELKELGYIKEYEGSRTTDGDVNVGLTRSGEKYFERKAEWIQAESSSILDEDMVADTQELMKLIALASKNESGLIASGFDTNDKQEVASINRLSRRRFLSVQYADNVPWVIEVTSEGFEFVRKSTKANDGKLARGVASIAGTFVGAAIKEISDL